MESAALGNWQVVRKSDSSVEVKFPQGVKVTKQKLDREELLGAIPQYEVVETSRTKDTEASVMCCSGNTAIA